MHYKCPLPQEEGTLGIDRTIETHNILVHTEKPTATRQKVHYSEKKKRKIWLLTLDGILTCLTFDIFLG